MKQLRYMVETVKKGGLQDANYDLGIAEQKMDDTYGGRAPKKVFDHFYNLIGKVQPFVFWDAHETPSQMVPLDDDELDLPFPTISIELPNWKATGLGGDAAATKLNPDAVVGCVLVNEMAPKEYEYFVQLLNPSDTGNMKAFPNVVLHVEGHNGNIFHRYVKDRLRFLKYMKVGVEEIPGQGAISVPANNIIKKKTHVIRQVIHIHPASISPRGEITGRTLEYTHRFSVRGHWRTIEGIGKDREGNYCVEGFTWVKEHVRGPEDKPFIRKTRVVQRPMERGPQT